MKTLKTALLFLLILSMLPACALSEDWLSALFGSSGPSLKYVSVPEEAFGEQSSRVIAASGDGQHALIMNAYEIYLWDTLQNERQPLTFNNEEEAAAFDSRVETAVVMSLTSRINDKEKRQQKQTEIMQVKASYLNQHGLERFTSFDQIYECFPHMVSIGASVEYLSANYAIVAANQLGVAFLVNLGTGDCSLIDDVKDTALCGDKLLTYEGIKDLATGETHLPAVEPVDGSGLNSLVNRIELLKDDSILMLIPSSQLDTEDYSREMFLIDVSTERTRLTGLGKFRVSGEPTKMLITGNGRYVAVYNPSAYYTAQALIIDRDKGEIIQMDDSLFLVAATEDAFICYDYNGSYMLMLLDPETMDKTTVSIRGLDTGGIVNFTAAGSVTGNGEGMYFIQREIMHGYFELVN